MKQTAVKTIAMTKKGKEDKTDDQKAHRKRTNMEKEKKRKDVKAGTKQNALVVALLARAKERLLNSA